MDVIEEFVHYVPKRDLVLQAGGGHGVYPNTLAKWFKQVVTVEADAHNFWRMCLATNYALNIKPIHAGLWSTSGKGALKRLRPMDELTGYIVDGNEVDLITIDSLGIKPDLIWLDIEGAEHHALMGAQETLSTCNAVIIEEGKDLEHNVGTKRWAARDLLWSLGFKSKFRRDLDSLYMRDGN